MTTHIAQARLLVTQHKQLVLMEMPEEVRIQKLWSNSNAQ